MANLHNLPLQERIPLKNTFQRVSSLLILTLLLSLLLYRLTSLHSHGPIWLIAFLCETWFTFIWVLYMNAKWNPVKHKTYPERLLKRSDHIDLPAVDMFVTTADPKLEPPIITANTVLSLLAVEYPAHKLACYVSDDGASPITFYSLLQASKFAKLWVPFCKKYNIRVRVPFVYFSSEPRASQALSQEFMDDWRCMKNEYDELSRRIDDVASLYMDDHELADFSNIERGNHPSLVKVIWENKESLEDGIPHLVYVAREKRPKRPHHYKAGAMNVLARVSGVMTNAPFMLNVDCDMFANNPEVILHGMCLLLGFDNEVSSGFVQAPQQFYGALKDDPFGNQLVVLHKVTGLGLGGIQGPFYGGTGCFHRRKILYGSAPGATGVSKHDDLSYKELQRIYGDSRELIKSASQITSGKIRETACNNDLSSSVEDAKRVASCTYEFNTCWGNEIGWAYGSMTEDVLTGSRIHSMGWKSVWVILDPPAFLGSAPTGGPASLTQYKRWSTGLLEILLSRSSPIIATFTKQLRFRMCLAYLVVNVWAPRSIGELCYALLPAYCLLANTSFMPKASEPVFVIPLALFLISNIHSLIEYFQCGLSVRACWNNQRMQRIFAMTAWLFGLVGVFLKTLGLSETIFEVTQKDQQSDTNDTDKDLGRFTFDNSPMFVSGTAVLLVNLVALAVGLLRLHQPVDRGSSPGLGEFACNVWVVFSFWPFVRGLVGRGSFGIPWPVILKAAALASLFMQFCGLGWVH